jgi:hypothetical protein
MRSKSGRSPAANRAEIKVEDCKDCVGEKFADRGRAQARAQGVLRREDLPQGKAMVRAIRPSRGIRGISQPPNRLNPILGADNTVVEASWE